MQVPSKRELARLFDEAVGDHVHFTETVCSWPSLRVLDHLYANEPRTTGELARELNMDMRDARDRLDALAEWGVLRETDDGWVTTTDRITVTVRGDDGLNLDCSVAARSGAFEAGEIPAYRSLTGSAADEPSVTPTDAETDESATPTDERGVVGGIADRIRNLFR